MTTEREDLEVVDGIGVFRPAGTFHWRQAVGMVSRGIGHAKALELKKLLIVTTRLEGFKSPSVAARVEVVREWAEAADGRMTIAMVVRRDFIDPGRIGVVAAAIFGASTHVFESEAEAMKWLRDH
ncbi:MAG: hypothetical protein ABIP49_05765 [Lysobacterales bacterium]